MDYKKEVHERDVVCQHCGCKGSKGNILTVHHIKPKCQGGPNTAENCILLCEECHRAYHMQNGYPHGRARSKKTRRRKRRR